MTNRISIAVKKGRSFARCGEKKAKPDRKLQNSRTNVRDLLNRKKISNDVASKPWRPKPGLPREKCEARHAYWRFGRRAEPLVLIRSDRCQRVLAGPVSRQSMIHHHRGRRVVTQENTFLPLIPFIGYTSSRAGNPSFPFRRKPQSNRFTERQLSLCELLAQLEKWDPF